MQLSPEAFPLNFTPEGVNNVTVKTLSKIHTYVTKNPWASISQIREGTQVHWNRVRASVQFLSQLNQVDLATNGKVTLVKIKSPDQTAGTNYLQNKTQRKETVTS